MSITAWLFFLPACFAINLAPGPNNLLSINVAARHGFMTAFVGGTGRLIAFASMLVLAATGLAVVLHASEVDLSRDQTGWRRESDLAGHPA